MNNIKSTTFYQTWLQVVKRNKKELLRTWGSNTDFTSLMLHDDNSIICQIADQLKLICYNRDYYALDAVLYNREDLVPKIPENQIWLRDIQIAFEHENVFRSGIYQEVAHLLITNAKLKVLVTYPVDTPHDELDYLQDIISNTRHAKSLSENENFLIIFGYANGFAWEGFLYTNKGWRELN